MALNVRKTKSNLSDFSLERIMNNNVRFNLNIIIVFSYRMAYQHFAH